MFDLDLLIESSVLAVKQHALNMSKHGGYPFQKLLFQYWEKPKFGVTFFQKTAI